MSAGRLWVDASGKTLTVDGSAVTQPVSNTVLSVVGGGTEAAAQRVTIANDSTGVLSVDDNGGSLTVDGTVAVSGTTAVSVAAAATSIGKAEDSVAADLDVGVPAMAIRKATPATLSSLDGDYEMLQMSVGRLWVDASGKTLTVDGSAVTQPVSNTVLSVVGGGTEAAAQRVTIATDSTGVLSVDDNGGSLTVDGTVAVSGTVTTKETRSATSALTSPAALTVASSTVLASNANRLGATIWNEGGATAYIKFGATASVTSYTVQVVSGAFYEVPYGYTGIIDGITSSSTAQVRVTELTA
jgi:hypothetical protein